MRSTLARRFSPSSTLHRGIITGPRFTPVVQSLPSIVPFVAPEEQERVRGSKFAVRLGANENTFGPSPKAIAAMQESVDGVWKYGDPKSHDLRIALAEHNGVAPANIVVGEGIDGIMANVAHLLVGPGDSIVTSHGTYPTLNYFVAGRGGVLQTVPYGADGRHDLIALLAKAHETRAKAIYLVNPDNPSGTWHPAANIEAMIEGLPQGTLLLLDEAYLELAPKKVKPSIAAEDLRVLRFRTFSKAYGMAGARIGYAIGAQEIIMNFDKIRNHFGIGRIGQAGALAALKDTEYLDKVCKQMVEARKTLKEIAISNGLKSLPSATNFVTIDCGQDSTFARAVLTSLLEQDIFARMPPAAPLDRCIRVSCSTPEDMQIFARALPRALEEAAQRQLSLTSSS